MQTRSATWLIPVLLTAIGTHASAADVRAPNDTQFARELHRLKQIDLIKLQLAAAKGTPQEDLWKAQNILAQFDALTKDRTELPRVTAEYLQSLRTYLASARTAGTTLDGAWALDHARFILTRIAQPVLTPMEYFSPTRRDREALAPLATLADDLLTTGDANFAATLKAIEDVKPFDEKAYMLIYPGSIDLRFFSASAQYARAMSLDAAADERRPLLKKAIESLADWAVDDTDNGRNHESYLLRGKVYTESGDGDKALADFAKAADPKAPEWVQYQAQYQAVAGHLKAKNISRARTVFDTFRRWIPRDNVEAQRSADLLAYRVAWAAAEAGPEADRATAQRNALDILSDLVDKDARFRDLVYELLATQVPENADVTKLLPLQQLAVARLNSRDQSAETEEGRRRLQTSLTVATALKNNDIARRTDRLEATYLSGIANTLLNKPADAAADEIQFAQTAPSDARARQLLELAMRQLATLRQQAASANQPASPEVLALSEKALTLAIETFKEEQWLYAKGRLFEDSGKKDDAAAIYEKLNPQDKAYFEARYRLVMMAAEKFSALSQPAAKTPAAKLAEAAEQLFKACSTFSALLDNPPASVPPEILEAGRAYRPNIWFIETGTALNPAVKQPQTALDRLNKLDEQKNNLSDAQKTGIFRYRLQAYQMAGKTDDMRRVVREYLAANPASATNDLRILALNSVAEVEAVEPTDPAQAKILAANVVEILQPLIDLATSAPGGDKSDTAFEYRITQAEMLTRAGKFAEAQKLAVELQDARKEDVRAFMTEARAMFAQALAEKNKAGFSRAQDYFTRILARRATGSEPFWECWLRILQCMEAQDAANTEIKKRLSDLKGVYGTKFGGERFRADFTKLAQKYAIP